MTKNKKKHAKAKSARKHKRLSADIVLKYLSQRSEPANTKSIAETLGRVGKAGRDETFAILESLRDQGKVNQLSKHRWATQQAIKVHRGKVVGHVDGHGYVLTEDTREKVFLRTHEMREVLHNDRVEVRVVGRDRRKRLFGQIVDVLERGNELVVGRYFQENQVNFVVPDDQRIGQDIFVLPEHINGAKSGQVVSVKITKHPTRHFQPVGEIVEVLGDYLAPGMEIEIAIRKHKLPHQWPETVTQQISGLDEQISDKDKQGRIDLTALPLVTIDGEDARDFDDAVYCEAMKEGKTRLIVAIADVSHYVKQNTPLDTEAWQRGNSVYFPQHVIPMLPEVLSNGLCSLNPKVDRLCFVCDMQIEADGHIDSYEFYPAVMHSQARLTYTEVAKLVDGQDTDIDPHLRDGVMALYHLSQRLKQHRTQKGAIEFEIPEPVIVFDEQRKIDKVIPRIRNDAHKLIEECMLAANICASLFLDESQLVGLYRVHDEPDADKVADLRAFLRQFRLLLKGGEAPQPNHFSEVMSRVDDPQLAHIVQTSMLRSMKQARYSEENAGHYALNFDSYTHFTSPIRRYSDLIVHRQIKRLLANPDAQDDDQVLVSMTSTAEHISATERTADMATREAVQWLKCEYMSHRIGEKMWGTVSSVQEFGLFVELDEVFVDGLVHITSLGQDYYRYEHEHRQLVGESSGRTYKLGQKLQVQVSRVDMEQGRIDFELVDVINEKFTRQRSKKRTSGNKKRNR